MYTIISLSLYLLSIYIYIFVVHSKGKSVTPHHILVDANPVESVQDVEEHTYKDTEDITEVVVLENDLSSPLSPPPPDTIIDNNVPNTDDDMNYEVMSHTDINTRQFQTTVDKMLDIPIDIDTGELNI